MCRSSRLRCTHPARVIPSVLAVLGLTLLLGLGVTLATPAPAQAQGFHGIATAKNCDSPVEIGEAYTCSYQVSNTVDTGTGAPGSADTLTILGISDTITNTTPPVDSGPLLDSFADPGQIVYIPSGINFPSCTASPGRTCTLPPGTTIIFGPESFYAVPAVDATHPTPIQDQLSVIWHDTCDSGANNCNPDDQLATSPGSADVVCGPCDAPNECTTATCNEETGFVCVFAPVDVSTPCTDTDGNECTNAGCEVDPNDPTLGVCVQDHAFVPDSTPCQETDGNACTTAGCDGNGTCDQNHGTVICDPPTECQESNICNPNTGVCVVTNKADSTPCQETDGNACTTAGCDGNGTCDQNHSVKTCPEPTECQDSNTCNTTTGNCDIVNTPDSTPCEDTDGQACTTAGCDGQGTCDQNHVNTCQVLGCRITAGGITPNGTIDQGKLANVKDDSFGGQVGAPCGCIGNFDTFNNIQGQWQDTRHATDGGLTGIFHASEFNSLVCGCDGVLDGNLCNPGDRGLGPEPRPAPANEACFSGVGDFTPDQGKKTLQVAFRVEVEDRGEPATGKNAGPSSDVYRLRIWIPAPGEDLLDTADAVACTGPLQGRDNFCDQVVRPPDIDDGGILDHGNIQIHPQIPSHVDICPVPAETCPQPESCD